MVRNSLSISKRAFLHTKERMCLRHLSTGDEELLIVVAMTKFPCGFYNRPLLRHVKMNYDLLCIDFFSFEAVATRCVCHLKRKSPIEFLAVVARFCCEIKELRKQDVH